jgi:hypothetical protein
MLLAMAEEWPLGGDLAATPQRNPDLLSRPSHPGLAEHPKLKSGLPSLRK